MGKIKLVLIKDFITSNRYYILLSLIYSIGAQRINMQRLHINTLKLHHKALVVHTNVSTGMNFCSQIKWDRLLENKLSAL